MGENATGQQEEVLDFRILRATAFQQDAVENEPVLFDPGCWNRWTDIQDC